MDSMEQIYKQHAKTVYGFLLSKTRDADLAEELTQETFFQAVKGIERFKGDCNVSTWLCAIAKNLYFQHRKELVKEHRLAENATEAESESFFDVPPPGWDQIEILKAIHTLKEPMREVVYLRLASNLNFRQIGEIMDKSENWARVTFYRGKEKIMEEVKRHDQK